MKDTLFRAFVIAVPLGALVTAFMWRLSTLLSSDAIAMAIGLSFGVLAGLPAAALVLIASRRAPGYDDYDPPTIDVTTYADEVTPYTHLFRRATGMPPLPDRQTQIDDLEAYLEHLKTLNNSQRDPRQNVVRWQDEAGRVIR